MTDGWRAERVALADMPKHRDDWTDLVGRALEPNIFCEPVFALAAARHLAPRPGPLFILAWRIAPDGAERLGGLAIVARRALPFAASRVFSNPQATAAFPVLDRDHATAALATLLGTVSALPGRPAALALSGVPVDGPTAKLVEDRSAIVAAAERAVLRSGTPASGLSAKARKELRRQERRMADHGLVTFDADPSTLVQPRLDRFLALEARGWKGRRGTALGQGRSLRAFITEVATGLALSDQIRIDDLSVAGKPVAIAIVLRSGDRAWYWKTAFDEAFGRFSPGVQLTLRLSERHAADPTLVLTDSCAIPGHAMIDRVWSGRMEVVDLLVSTRSPPDAAFARATAIERWRLKARATAKQLLSQIRSRFSRDHGA